MNRTAFILATLFTVGCAASGENSLRPLVAEDRRPESRDLPIDPQVESIPEGYDTTFGEDHIEPLEEGSCVAESGEAVSVGPCPSWSGIAISESRAARDVMYRSRYRELRRTYDADRQVWAAQRELYEAQIVRDREEIGNLQPTWWEQHDGTVLTALGVIVGAAITVAITFAVEEATDR